MLAIINILVVFQFISISSSLRSDHMPYSDLSRDIVRCIIGYINTGPWASICRLVSTQWAQSIQPSSPAFAPYETAIQLRDPDVFQYIHRNGVP